MSSSQAEGGALFRGRRPARLSFGTSGLRGRVADMTDLETWINVTGFLDHLEEIGDVQPGDPVALAGDLRPSTDGPERSILRAVARAVRDAGLEPVNLGRIPTPALILHGLIHRSATIMVTGSHIPFDRNGIKFNTPAGEVLKEDEPEILDCVARARREQYARPAALSPFDDAGALRSGEAPPLPTVDDRARQTYVRRYTEFFPAGALAGLRVVLYEHSAVGRELMAEILRALGAEVVPLGRSDMFVALDTEAISADRLETLQALSTTAAAGGPVDAVVSTDGDGDRPLLAGIDAGGRVRFLGGDRLGLLVAEVLGADAVAVPVSATDAIEHHLAPSGVTTLRTRIGSPWVIAAMRTLRGNRRVGWESNGGFLTASELDMEGRRLAPLPTRDAVLPLVAALFTARQRRLPLVELFATLPRRHAQAGLIDEVAPADGRAVLEYLSAGDPEVRSVVFAGDRAARWMDADGREYVADGPLEQQLDTLCERVARHFPPSAGFGCPRELNLLDGARITFDGGDIAHVRPSGNAPQLRLYAVAEQESRAAAIVAAAVREPDGILRQLLAAATADC